MNIDSAIKLGEIKIWLGIFTPSNPKIFNITNPKITLDLSIMDKAARESQCDKYLCGIDPVGFCSMIDLGRSYITGVSVCGEKMFGFSAISHLLSRHLEIDSKKVEKMITKKFEQGYTNIVFMKLSNSKGCETLPNDKFVIKKQVPDQDLRNQRLNAELKKSGSKFRCKTSKTYTIKTYGV